MNLTIPDPSLVVLIGPSGAGKSTFAARHFQPTEVVSSDFCRALVADDENNMAATPAAFRVLHSIAGERLQSRRLTVIDATSVDPDSRKPLLALALKHGCPPVAIVLDVPEEICSERSKERSGRHLDSRVIRQQSNQMRRSLENLKGEGFINVYRLESVEAVDAATVVRRPF
jgi:protein phosphatase